MPLPKNKEMYTGIKEITFSSDEDLAKFYETQHIDEDLEINQYLLIKDKKGSVIDKYRKHKDGSLVKVKTKSISSTHLGKIKPLNEYQDCMVDMILDNSITVKSSVGIPGGGKSYLFIVYGIEKVLKGEFDKIIYIKNNVDIGHEKLGSLPGVAGEKLEPWSKVLEDVFVDKYYVDKYRAEGKLETEYIGYTVGRTFNNSFIIVDDSQQLSKKHVYNLTTRLGHNSVICFAGDLYQTYSSKYENGNNGITFLHNQLKGQEFFGAVHTSKSERSYTAQKCAELLFEGVIDG